MRNAIRPVQTRKDAARKPKTVPNQKVSEWVGDLVIASVRIVVMRSSIAANNIMAWVMHLKGSSARVMRVL